MPGRETDYNFSCISARKLLRTLDDVDTDPALIPADECIVLGPNRYGCTARIYAAVHFAEELTSLTLELWADLTGDGTKWALVEGVDFDKSSLYQFTELPAGKYVLLVSDITQESSSALEEDAISIFEQHTS